MLGNMMTLGLMLKAYDGMSAIVASASNKSIASLSRIEAKMHALSESAEKFGRTLAADGALLTGVVSQPLRTFAELEDASTNLKVAMMDNLGQVPPQFEAINKQAIELGNLLPGVTSDFINGANALIEQGTGFDTIINGGLRSASQLAVLLKMPAQEAAEMVAKLREAYGLADNELEKMADLTQRARYAFGMTPQDIKTASAYSGATQNILGLTGLENAKKLLAVQGLGAGVSLEGSSFGTSFAMMLSRTAELKDKLAKTSKEMRAVNADLREYGINLEFFDNQGSFMGIDNLVRQLEKTNVMSKADQLNLFKKLFGIEAGRPAAIIAQKGWEGYQEAMTRMERQASLQQRIEELQKTLMNQWEKLTGAATNALSSIGAPIAVFVAPAISALSGLVDGPLQDFISQNSTLIGVLGTTLLVIGLASIALGMLGMTFGFFTRYVAGGIAALRVMGSTMRVAQGWMIAHRLEILRLMGVQRAQIALQQLQQTIAYRGGAWQFLQYQMMLTRYRMLELTSAMTAMAASSLQWVRTNLLSLSGLRALALGFSGSLLSGIKAATIAVRAFSVALLTNPVTWIIAAIALGALLIWKFWQPLAAFFSGFWTGLQRGIAPLMPLFRAVGSVAMTALAPLIRPLQVLWGWFVRIFDQVEDTGGAARSLGETIGQAIGDGIMWVAELVMALFDLPGKFYDAGAAMMTGLFDGIIAFANSPIEAIKGLGNDLIGWFASLLDINSPSRVFMGLGGSISEGVAVGIEGKTPQVQTAMSGLNDAATLPGNSPTIVGPVAMPNRSGSSIGGLSAAGTTIHFSPVINVNGGGDVRGQVQSALTESYREFENNMRRYQAAQQRRAYS